MDDRYLSAEVTQEANARTDALTFAVQFKLRNRVVIELFDPRHRRDRAHEWPVQTAVHMPATRGGAIERPTVEPLAPGLHPGASHAEIHTGKDGAAFREKWRLIRIRADVADAGNHRPVVPLQACDGVDAGRSLHVAHI